jgi:GT2 family glycosyltransferase
MDSATRKPVLSIIIVTWNGKKYAEECLHSLVTRPLGVPTEIIVVDNASSDGTPEAIRAQFPQVHLIENDKNLGFAKANNIGLAASRGEYVCLVNSDVVIPPACMERMVAYMDANPTIGVLGPKMLSPDGGIGYSVMRLPTVWNTLCCALGLHAVFPKSGWFGGFMMSGYPYNSIDDVEVLTGWFWMVPRKALDQVGGLDEQFFMYGEDIDWCYRFLKAGWRVVFYPDAEALHYGAASSAKAPTRFYIEMRRANLQYFRKHAGPIRTFGYRLATWLHEVTRILGYSAIYSVSSARRPEAALKIKRSIACIRWLSGDKTQIAPQQVEQHV